MSTNYQLGRQGEAAAAKFLTTNGYQILERNYRYLKAEVDIIAIKNNSLVAIESKTLGIRVSSRIRGYFIILLILFMQKLSQCVFQ